ncbi:uncharacterized protein RNJ42_03132 [Nakaseomyces bracarensis]|uniref:uncharacterized protein n=1 Tax=Nakaseomyces bracarensis TaxID=273131 RepID=UPI00387143C0
MDYLEMDFNLEMPLPLMEAKYDESFPTMNLGDIHMLEGNNARDFYYGNKGDEVRRAEKSQMNRAMMDTPMSSVIDGINSASQLNLYDVSSTNTSQQPQSPLNKSNFFNFNWNDEVLLKQTLPSSMDDIPSAGTIGATNTYSTDTINCATLTSTEFLNNFLKGDFYLGQGVFKPHRAPVTPPLDEQTAFNNDPTDIFMTNPENTTPYENQHAGAIISTPNTNSSTSVTKTHNNNTDHIMRDVNVDTMFMNPLTDAGKITEGYNTKRIHKKRKMSKVKTDSESSDGENNEQGRKCSDARLSAIGLAKKLNLSTPQEALEREKYILDIFQHELNYPLGYKTWIRDTDKETRTYLIEELHSRVKDKYPEYDHNILETIIRRATYSMMQSRLRRERRAKIKEKSFTS